MIPIMRDDRPMTQILVADFLRFRFCCHFPIGRAVIVLRDLFPTHPGRSVRLLAPPFMLSSWRLVYLRFGAQSAKPRLSCACEYGSNLGLGNSSLPCRSEAANGGCRHLRIVNDWVLCVVRILEDHIWCLGKVFTMPFLSNGHAQWL